jgi:NDP-sugar pyrophosphorylase family protein
MLSTLNKFDSSFFFDLSAISFKTLFNKNIPVWEVLKFLESYILSQPLGIIETDLGPNVFYNDLALITIGSGCKIYPGAYIEGPCIIKENVEIGPGAYIRPNTLIEKGCKIGHCSEVKESILLSEVKIPHFNYVGNSILGNRVNLGAGACCANYKINKKEVFIKVDGQIINTELKKFGAIIGDDSFLGCNSVTNPGTILKKESKILPCTNLKGAYL